MNNKDVDVFSQSVATLLEDLVRNPERPTISNDLSLSLYDLRELIDEVIKEDQRNRIDKSNMLSRQRVKGPPSLIYKSALGAVNKLTQLTEEFGGYRAEEKK